MLKLTKLPITNEIASALFSAQCDSDPFLATQIRQAPEDTLYSVWNLDSDNISVHVVENTRAEITLVLPFYSALTLSFEEKLQRLKQNAK